MENEFDDEVKDAIKEKYQKDKPTKDAIDALQREVRITMIIIKPYI